uniref:Kinesin motor domain-containing protein n=1 Tax=Heterorhabditis bacteriophora TaxID=37862 RepID=A0A1I7WJQ7_HETBA
MSIGQSVRQDASQAAPTRRRAPAASSAMLPDHVSPKTNVTVERRASETFRLKNKSGFSTMF